MENVIISYIPGQSYLTSPECTHEQKKVPRKLKKKLKKVMGRDKKAIIRLKRLIKKRPTFV